MYVFEQSNKPCNHFHSVLCFHLFKCVFKSLKVFKKRKLRLCESHLTQLASDRIFMKMIINNGHARTESARDREDIN